VSEAAAVRRRATALAGHTGDDATASTALSDEDPGVRATALGALDRLGRLDDARLVAALGDGSSTVRRRAAELAATRPGVPLLALLDDADASVVEVAAFACGEQGEAVGPDVVERLALLATSHEDALVREAAVAALGAIGAPAGLPAILAATGDKATVRRRAVIALAPFEGPEVQAALERARSDRDWQVRQAAEDLLAD
jgi:HEAT repeat protein